MFLFRFLGLTLLVDRINDIKSHKELRLINLTWIAINITLFAYLIVTSRIFTRNYSRMSEIIELANYVFALATVLVVMWHVQAVNGKDLIWHRKLHEIDRLLRDKCNSTINHRTIRRWNLWKVLITFALTGACSVINIGYATRSESQPTVLIWHNYFLKTIINLRYIQNAVRIDYIKHRILAVHDVIRQAVERNTVEWRIVLVVDKFNRKHQNPSRKIDDVNDVLLFKRFYATLFETMKLLENCFGWSLLAMISFTFIDLTSNLYWFFIACLDLDRHIYLIDCVFEIIPSVVIISCLIFSSFDANRRAKEVINLATLLYTNTTSCYNKMIKEFLMQIHHERIENSANDFFIVDFQLFSAVGNLSIQIDSKSLES